MLSSQLSHYFSVVEHSLPWQLHLATNGNAEHFFSKNTHISNKNISSQKSKPLCGHVIWHDALEWSTGPGTLTAPPRYRHKLYTLSRSNLRQKIENFSVWDWCGVVGAVGVSDMVHYCANDRMKTDHFVPSPSHRLSIRSSPALALWSLSLLDFYTLPV